MIRTILVDDDPKHLKSLHNTLSELFKQVDVVAISGNIPDAVQHINKLKPQLVFLDIEMGQFTGFDLLEMVDERDFEVIFTTSFQRYAIQAIKASALDYIDKPIDKDKLAEALQRYRDKSGKARINNLLENFRLPNQEQRIALPDSSGMNFYEANRIICCTSDNSTTYFHLKTDDPKTPVKRITVSKGLAHWEDFLFGKGFFFRVHNRYMINIIYIKRFVKSDNSYLVFDHLEHIPVARNRKDELIRFLKSKGMVL
jgi:two-component system LytT family response regulator